MSESRQPVRRADEAALVRSALEAWEKDGAAIAIPQTWLAALRRTLQERQRAHTEVYGALVDALNTLSAAGLNNFRRAQLEAELAEHAPEQEQIKTVEDSVEALEAVVRRTALGAGRTWRRACSASVVGAGDDTERLATALAALQGLVGTLDEWPETLEGYAALIRGYGDAAAVELANLRADSALSAARRRRGVADPAVASQLAATLVRGWLLVGMGLGAEAGLGRILCQERGLLIARSGCEAQGAIDVPWLLPEWLLYWQLRKRAGPAIEGAGSAVSQAERAQYEALVAKTEGFDERWQTEIPRLDPGVGG